MELMACLAAELEARCPVAVLTVMTAPPGLSLQPGQKWLIGRDRFLAGESPAPDLAAPLMEVGRAVLAGGSPNARNLELAGVPVRVYAEPYLPAPVLVVVGAGHVAQPVAAMARMAGFYVVVLDDRPEFANRERFPTADRIICAPFDAGLRSLHPGPAHHVVLVTRGHRYDMDCLIQLIDLPLPYIGMIGSRTRVQTVFRLLEEEHGVDPDQFRKVYAPIGLDIGANTPVEIAVAVLAELIKARRGGTGEHLSRLPRALVHQAGRRRGDGP